MKNTKNLRTIKITSVSRTRAAFGRQIVFKPKIVLQGNWLEKAGFEIGENIDIDISIDKLTIRKPQN